MGTLPGAAPTETLIRTAAKETQCLVTAGPPRHAHGDLTSLAPHERLPEILVVPREKIPRAPQLEESTETPPSSRAEGLLFLHGLESNPGSSLQTEEEAGLP